MKLFLRDLSKPLCDAWRKEFAGLADVLVQHGDIFSSSVDACVSPANSFGWMDGGINAYYVKTMGPQVQSNTFEAVRHLPFKELLVGQALVIPTRYTECPHMIMAPTMRTPGPTTQLAVFLSTRAALSRARRRQFKTLAMPGMGTLTGMVPYPLAANAMREAYKEVFGV